MTGRYELLLRCDRPLAAEELAAVRQAADGARLHSEPFTRGETTRGVDLAADIDDPAGGRRLCELAFELARHHRLTVYDPQLSREVVDTDDAAVCESFQRKVDFARSTFFASSSPKGARRASVRLWLIIGSLVVLFLLVIEGLRCAV